MPTVLRVSGPHNLLHDSMMESEFEFKEAIASVRKRKRGEKTEEDDSTFNFTVSEAEGECVPLQIQQTESFLREYKQELNNLKAKQGVEYAALDFSWDFPETNIAQWNSFPVSLLKLCVELGIDLKVSVYRSSEEGSHKSG